jgi:hypothetical protein
MTTSTSETDNTRPLEGRVAQILNARELVINIGEKDGVTQGMKFAVLSESPMQIIDPQTKEILDTVDREKVRVRTAEVRPRITICRTYLVRTVPGGALYNATLAGLGEGFNLARQMQPPRKVVDTLRADDKDLPPPLSEDESYVKVNDRVVQILEDVTT